MSFGLIKRMSLENVSDKWKDCYIDFNSLTIKEVKEVTGQNRDLESPDGLKDMMQESIDMLKKKIVKGKGIDTDGKEVEITKDNFEDLPSSILNEAVNFILSQNDSEKKST